MTRKHLLASVLLFTGAAFLATQAPVAEVSAQDAKAEKKTAFLKKLADRKKTEDDKARADAAAAKAAQAKPAVAAPKVTPKETKPLQALNPADIAKLINREVDKKLSEAKIAPSSRSSDAEFLRRVSLDITGVIPSPEKVESFLNSSDSDKRAKLVDELLANSRYGTRLSDIWANQMIPLDSTIRYLTRDPLANWLADSFNANKPWDRMAHDIISASGEQAKNGAVTYYMFNQGVDKMTDSVGKLFLGVQIQCAQCHNHPFTHWKQEEYWGLAQFFYNVNVVAQRNGKQTDIVPGVSETARANRKGNPLPESAKAVAAKFLGGEKPSLQAGKPYRPVLADWLCTAENPFFAKSMVNRVWAQYFGRGIVNPIDDLSDENEASHPELLQQLSSQFANGGFDVKNLIRAICMSDAYQRTSQPTPENKLDEVLYSHMAMKVMTPEQLYDSLSTVAGNFSDAGGRGKGMNGGPKAGANAARERFATYFMGSENPKATDYEHGIPQALRLMNSPRLSSPAAVSDLVSSKLTPEKAIEKLYLKTVSRRPTDAELKRLTDHVKAASGDPKTPYSDILWALLNSSEFALNH